MANEQSRGNAEQQQQGGSDSNSQDLKEREYRDKEGDVHHHTHTAEAMDNKKNS